MSLEYRHYLDYNATSPISSNVLESLRSEEWFFSNPSSVHYSGKKTQREINLVSDYLYETFSLPESTFDIFYHSGATEGINTIIKGFALEAKNKGEKFIFVCLESDHSCVTNQIKFLKILGHETIILPILRDGSLDVESTIKKLTPYKNYKILLNWTWSNNESGIILPLEQAVKIKQETGCLVHVDAVQIVGKYHNWQQLESSLDFYTFSGHKFGALKGTGFSFIRNQIEISPLLNGGGQQRGLRSGTENTWGIFSLKLALEEISQYNLSETEAAKMLFESRLNQVLGEKGEIVGQKGELRNTNTTYFIIYDALAQNTAMAFDIAGFDLSNGSACSSGAVVPSRVLKAMGYTDRESKSALRVSLPQNTTKEYIDNLWPDFSRVLTRFI